MYLKPYGFIVLAPGYTPEQHHHVLDNGVFYISKENQPIGQ